MNNAQMNIDPETGEERHNEAIDNTHQYNLRPRLTPRSHKYALAQINNQLIMLEGIEYNPSIKGKG